MKVYIASSWRNKWRIADVVKDLKDERHEVYDFTHPPEGAGFGWEQINANWKGWNTQQFKEALDHPLAEAGWKADFEGMQWADVCVLVMPCGRSAHLEAGWFVGAGKRLFILANDETLAEPELSYKFATLVESIDELIEQLGVLA